MASVQITRIGTRTQMRRGVISRRRRRRPRRWRHSHAADKPPNCISAQCVVAVRPKPSFLPFFEYHSQKPLAAAGVDDGSDGGQTLDCCLTGCHLAGRPADRDPLVAVRVAYSRRRAGTGQPRRRAAWRRAFQAITARLPQKRNTGRPTSLTHPPTATPATIATTAAMLRSRTVQGVGGLRAHRSVAVAMLRTVPGRGAQSPRRCENWAGVSIGGLVPIRSVRSRSPDTSTSTCAVSARASR
jgi:hypothetical protein